MVSASSEALRAAAMAKDSGEELRLEINMDATAEAAMGSRKGPGDAEQIGTAFCWAHDMVIIGTTKLV